MLPRGGSELIAMRKAGKAPSSEVWVNYGDFIEPFWWKYSNTSTSPELLVRPEDPIDRLDLRCVVGLNLILFFKDWNSKAAKLFDRLTEYANEVAVMSPAFDDEIGWRWTKKYGRVEFGESHYIVSLSNALADATCAARKNDKAAYSAAQAKEKQIREAAPWLNC